MVTILFLSVGCIDVPAMNGLIDRIVPEEEKNYQALDVSNVEGNFAPDPEQDSDGYVQALEEFINDPLQFQQTLQNLSWEDNVHTFRIESEWQARFVILLLTVNYDAPGGTDPSDGPAGTVDISIKDPNGKEHGEGYEMVFWGQMIQDRPYLLPPIYGTWTVTISGSGLEGFGAAIYSGNYQMKVESERLV